MGSPKLRRRTVETGEEWAFCTLDEKACGKQWPRKGSKEAARKHCLETGHPVVVVESKRVLYHRPG